MRFSVSSGPSVEPLSTAEAKTHLRIDTSTEDTLVGNYIESARGAMEVMMRRAFITQTITLKLDAFPSGTTILLPRPPAQSITSVQYVDTAGATQTVSSGDYTLDTTSEPARLSPAYNVDWPDTRVQDNAVTVTYVAGYGDAATDVPEGVRLAIRLLIGCYYEQREAISSQDWSTVPLGIQVLASVHTVPEVY